MLTQRWQKLMNLRLQKFSRSPASRHSKKSLSFSLTTMMNEDRQLATWTLHKQDNDDIYLVAGQILHCGRRPIINLWFLATLEAAKRDLWQMDFELSRKVELFFRMVNHSLLLILMYAHTVSKVIFWSKNWILTKWTQII